MAHLLGAEELSLSFPTKQVFDGITVGIDDGDRIGVVGANGDGKSTLLKLLSKRLAPDEGRVTHRGGLRVGILDQADRIDTTLTIGQTVVGDLPEYEWAGNPRIRDVIAGLLNDLDWNETVDSLSGGQRRRVALAALLIQDLDIVMLDEPTNHLDVEGVAWLARHLNDRWPKNTGGLIVVTHDRWFLDAVCNLTWEVYGGRIEPFEGGYAAYILQRAERNRSAAASEARRQNLLRKELAWLRRGAPARTAKPKFRIDAANELIANEPEPRDRVALSKLATARLGKDVVDVEDLSYSIEGNEILSDVTWRLGPGDRVGLVGHNGAGKSTMLRALSGVYAPTRGKAILDGEIGSLIDISLGINPEATGRENVFIRGQLLGLTKAEISARYDEIVEFAELGDFMEMPVRTYSSGMHLRLAFAVSTVVRPEILLMDEWLSVGDENFKHKAEARLAELVDATKILVIASHSRELIETTCNRVIWLEHGQVKMQGSVAEVLPAYFG